MPAMLTAITRAVSPAFANCQLSFIDRQPIDLAVAQQQHRNYEKTLEQLGAKVISLPAEPGLPDSMFVEDPAFVVDELAVIMPLGTPSRRPEAESLARALAPYRKLAYITAPAMMEGGDLLRIGKRVYAGLSRRTNPEGIRQLTAILRPYHYEIIPVPVTGCLHLKSAVTSIGQDTLLANRAWFQNAVFGGYTWIDVAPSEPHAANALAIGRQIVFPASFPETKARIAAAGFPLIPINISELQKAESGLTCSSLLLEGHGAAAS
jgi:dimethylargininase